MSTPRTSALIEHIRQRDGQVGVGLGNAPEEWVVLCRELERELAILRTAFGITPSERVVPEQTPTHGSVLVDSGSTRGRISPVNDEVIQLERELAAMKSLIALAVDCGEACGMDGAYPDAWERMKASVSNVQLPDEAALRELRELRELRQYVLREISEARLRMDIYIVNGSAKQLKFARGQEDALVGVYNRIKELLSAETPAGNHAAGSARAECPREVEDELAAARDVIADLLANAVPAAAYSGDAGMVFVEMTEAEWHGVKDATTRARAFLVK